MLVTGKILCATGVILAVATSTVAQNGNAKGNYASVNGLKMYYEIHGSGQPLVLLHGGGSTIETSFGKTLPALAKTRQVIASAMFKRDGLYSEFWESMKHAKLGDMPEELREAYLRVAPNPKNLQSFHDKCVERMLEFTDWRSEDIQAINAPTLVLIADGDIVRPEHAVEMFRLLPHAQLAVLPCTDHMSIVKRADWQISMVQEFLEAPMPETKGAPHTNQTTGR